MNKYWIENKIDDCMNKWILNWNKVLWWMFVVSEEFCCNYIYVRCIFSSWYEFLYLIKL